MKGSLSWQLHLVRTYLANVLTRCSSPPHGEISPPHAVFAMRRTRVSSWNVGKISAYQMKLSRRELFIIPCPQEQLRKSLCSYQLHLQSQIHGLACCSLVYSHEFVEFLVSRYCVCDFMLFFPYPVAPPQGGSWAIQRMCWVLRSLPIIDRLCLPLVITPSSSGTHWVSASTPSR